MPEAFNPIEGKHWVRENREYDTPCWIWQRAKISTGYGVQWLGISRQHGKLYLAHRLMYEMHRGLIPDDREIDHLCRQRDCVNPDHLEAVTSAENTRRGNRVILNEEAVRQIRDRSNRSPTELAERFGVSLHTVHDLRYRRRKWKEVG